MIQTMTHEIGHAFDYSEPKQIKSLNNTEFIEAYKEEMTYFLDHLGEIFPLIQ